MDNFKINDKAVIKVTAKILELIIKTHRFWNLIKTKKSQLNAGILVSLIYISSFKNLKFKSPLSSNVKRTFSFTRPAS